MYQQNYQNPNIVSWAIKLAKGRDALCPKPKNFQVDAQNNTRWSDR